MPVTTNGEKSSVLNVGFLRRCHARPVGFVSFNARLDCVSSVDLRLLVKRQFVLFTNSAAP
jgi:hypothetical protein